ncbi:MAG TPA: DPP IV N-terminal domain-containing protein [Acidobacteriota bacterium]|nr:DPP IV N-terminal domain-containing protein [Acidobacteriota bacterium]
MKRSSLFTFTVVLWISCLFLSPLPAQVTRADYERAANLRNELQPLALNLPERPSWIDDTSRFWYRKTVKGGFEFQVMDAGNLARKPAFDHEKLAAALAQASKEKVDARKLPFQMISFVDDERAVQFDFKGDRWKCDLTSYTVTRIGDAVPFGPSGDPMSIWVRGPAPQAASTESKASPDGKWEAFIRNYNVWVRFKEKKDEFALSQDGAEGDYYTYASITWSPDSKKIAAYRLRRGYHRIIRYVQSSPADQLQPKYISMEYAKPGDSLDVERPVLFHVGMRACIPVDNALFPNPFDMSPIVWWKDSRAFTFEYNQRGHQVYRVIEVDALSGKPRFLINEEMATFFCYSGKKYRYDVADGKEIIWMSERDGWNHLYLYDGASGSVKNQITKGPWVIRGVEKVDEATRTIWFRASGMNPGQDPYFNHYYKINFDGTGLKPLTDGDANHMATFSPDMRYFVDTWSRVDLPPVMELRRALDGALVTQVEKTDITELQKAGWKPPEVFVAKGRDGKTDIWGVIIRPRNFDPKRKYPVIENIYAGPQDSFVPKFFSAYNPMQSLAELGFVVVQVDGMGTSNRSKAFHDICWKNLGDAGFPDRILWHRAIAAKYPWYDITRVGIYGNSAGGQSSLGGLLFHPEFYKAAVSASGCHDNRMDKIWWNEQWMGWPLGPEYAAASNVENAHRLQGKLLLIVGEMDTNVDPASTLQVVNALIKANKVFELLVIPGADHGMGGAYGERKRNDFFVHYLQGSEPPDWNGEGMP